MICVSLLFATAQSRLSWPDHALSRVVLALSCDDFFGDFESRLQELEAGDEALLVAFLDFSRRSPSATNVRLPQCLRNQAISLISISLPFFAGSPEDALQHLRVHDQCLDIIAHGFDMDVPVDQFDHLRSERVPKQFAVASGRLD